MGMDLTRAEMKDAGKRFLAMAPLAAAGIALIWATQLPTFTKWILTASIAIAGVSLVWVRDLLAHLPFKAVGVGGLKLDFPDITAVEPDEAEAEGGRDVSTSLDAGGSDGLRTTWLQLRWKLEMKLAYLAKHTLPDNLPVLQVGTQKPTRDDVARPFLTLGSLQHDGLLSEADAEVITTFLALSPSDLRVIDRASLQRFFDQVAGLASVLRSRVFAGLVAQYFDAIDWKRADDDRLVWLYHARGDIHATVGPVFSKATGGLATRRASLLARQTEATALRFVVVPKWPNSQSVTKSHDGVPIVPFDLLPSFLEAQLRRPRANETDANA